MPERTYECLSIETGADRIARLRLTRPELHNRFDEELHSEFVAMLLEISARSDIRALIFSAEGRSFSAGGDLAMMLRNYQSKELRDRVAWEAKMIYELFAALPFPVIAAVQGAAIGLGATLVAMSDIAIVWREAKIADPHVQLGLVAGDGGVIAWSQSIGLARAKRYLLTGERITGQRAFEIGLVSDVVESPEEVLPAAEKIAATIASFPRGGVEGTKRAFAKLTQHVSGPVFELGLAYEMETMASDDLRDMVQSMMNK